MEGVVVFLSLFDENPAVYRAFCPPRAVYADPHRHVRERNRYDHLVTTSSSSVRLGRALYQQVGASARERLKAAAAEQWGVPAYRFLLMPHPIANLTEAELDERAREMAPQVVKLLLERQD